MTEPTVPEAATSGLDNRSGPNVVASFIASDRSCVPALQRPDRDERIRAGLETPRHGQSSLNGGDAGDSTMLGCQTNDSAVAPRSAPPWRVDHQADGIGFDERQEVVGALAHLVDDGVGNAEMIEIAGCTLRAQQAKTKHGQRLGGRQAKGLVAIGQREEHIS